jgi:hypothetical protein
VTIQGDRCDNLRSTDVTIWTPRNVVKVIETTTTGTGWENVVVVLSEIVDRSDEAIRRMQSREGTPTEAMDLIHRWKALPDSDKAKKPGTLYHWFCRRPRQATSPAKPAKTPDQLREAHRASSLHSIRSQMIRERGRPLSDHELSLLDSSVIDEMEKYDAKNKRISDTGRKAVIV